MGQGRRLSLVSSESKSDSDKANSFMTDENNQLIPKPQLIVTDAPTEDK